jgi:hypothetical protein
MHTNRLKQTEDDESKMAVLKYIKLHSKEVVRGPEWLIFVKNHGLLVTDIMLAMGS